MLRLQPAVQRSWQALPRQKMQLRKAASSAGQTAEAPNGRRTTQVDPAEVSRRMQQLTDLIQEAARLSFSTGPRGIIRAFQATDAVVSLTREYISRGQVDPPPMILRKLFEKLGATYIKLGQFIASSPSVFPEEYVAEFQKCLDKADPVPFATIKSIMQQELKQPLESVFLSIDPVPLASASIAQVHSAVLKSSNKEVVIKVLKPNVEDTLITDLNFVYIVSRILEFIEPDLSRLSLAGIIGDIRVSMLDEVDFRKEASHMQQFSSFLDEKGFRTLATCPFVYTQLCTKRVLVMERLVGAPLTDLDAIRAVTRRDPESVLIGALNTWFASVLGCESFHADVHAGNLLVLPDGRVGFIDFGIVGRISPVTWRGVEALINSLAATDYNTMARSLATIGACDEQVDLDAFAADLKRFFDELDQVNTQVVLTSNGASGGSLSAAVEVDQGQVNSLFLQLVSIAETHGIRFPREFGLFLKQLLYFDRYTRILAPQLEVFRDDRINVRTLSTTYGMQ